MPQRIFAVLITCFLGLGSATAAEIELDWNSTEVGFFELSSDDGSVEHGVAVYVTSNRIASEDDFHTIVPDFCANRLSQLLEFAAKMENAPIVSLLKLQLEFNGPKVGEHQSYVARAATIRLENGECSL